MFDELARINARPKPFEFSTTRELWTDEHTSARMLAYHLDGDVDLSSRNSRFLDRSADWIASRFALGPGVAVIDFGCGPGLYAQRLARHNAEVAGIDFSKRSLAYARSAAARERLPIDYIQADYLTFKTDKTFDLAYIIMCDFCAIGPAQRKKLLDIFHAILKPGGSVLLDAYSRHAFEARKEAASCAADMLDGFWSPERYYCFLNTFKYEQELLILDKYTIIEKTRTRTVYNWMQCFTPDTLEHEFTASGFTITDFHADVAGSPFVPGAQEFAVVARKK